MLVVVVMMLKGDGQLGGGDGGSHGQCDNDNNIVTLLCGTMLDGGKRNGGNVKHRSLPTYY